MVTNRQIKDELITIADKIYKEKIRQTNEPMSETARESIMKLLKERGMENPEIGKKIRREEQAELNLNS